MNNETIKMKESNNPFIYLSLVVFTLGTFTLETFISSRNIEMIYIPITVLTLIFAYLISNKRISIYKVEVMWLFFIVYFILNSAIHGKIDVLNVIDLVTFSFIFIFLLLMKTEVKYFKISIIMTLLLSIIYSFSSFFQYFNMDLYRILILPGFSDGRAEELLKLYAGDAYTGFTWQTAFISGYLVCGLGIILLGYSYVKSKNLRTLLILCMPVLLIALFMGGKRAHLIFMMIAFVVTYIFSKGSKQFIKRIIKSFLYIILILGIALGSIQILDNDHDDSPFNKIVGKFTSTIDAINNGEDVTSGRVDLYEFAFKHFLDNPLLGIGWREFKEISIGVINFDSGSHPHNIYIQLLTELGIPGLILFVIPIIYVLFLTFRLLLNYNEIFLGNIKWKFYIQFSLYIQIFLLLYGLTGNIITDHVFIYMYALAIVIVSSAINYSNQLNHKKGDEI